MANLTNNRINTTMTAAQVTAVKNALATIQTNMPFLVGLTMDERASIPKIDVSNKTFTEDAINAAVNNSAMLPGYLNVTSMQSDLALFNQIDELTGLLRQMLEKMEDTQMLAGSESYIGALTAYKLFTTTAEAGIAGADAIVEQLRQRFTNNTQKST
ncbi:hypothetical protein [Flavobacterium pallidum]|uniref:Uncharacterized protein n=1 Tax=Flavobacterium pallidum TaxID=2172098 RepID=A0A2S1SHS2_9FLAO|nr:hypothetical protein [Flavobacterium pallidum]AWI25892.1 hypothetical protein HYN49_08255 [Flavobacterium pallidum]